MVSVAYGRTLMTKLDHPCYGESFVYDDVDDVRDGVERLAGILAYTLTVIVCLVGIYFFAIM
jgi:hypothetical protein